MQTKVSDAFNKDITAEFINNHIILLITEETEAGLNKYQNRKLRMDVKSYFSAISIAFQPSCLGSTYYIVSGL